MGQAINNVARRWQQALHSVPPYRWSILLWVGLNLADMGLSLGQSATISHLVPFLTGTPRLGGYEVMPIMGMLPPIAFIAWKVVITVVAVLILALVGWLKYLRWLNLFYILLVCFNISQLIIILSR